MANDAKTKAIARGKAATFFACLGILGLIAVSLHLSAPASLSDQAWENKAYKAGTSLTKTRVMTLLNNVVDPEINLTVPELGLIYNLEVKDNEVKVLMTLTTDTCPWSAQLLADMRDSLFSDPAVKKLNIELTFNPPWSLDRIDPVALERVRAQARQSGQPVSNASSAPTI